jgi:hypothetical protein
MEGSLEVSMLLLKSKWASLIVKVVYYLLLL